jgi:dTDP-4-amino-4,6-dideoxygalactose transaminase
MASIVEIAKRRNLLIIEDAAQAHLASIDSKPVGTFGDAAIFSFYPTKNITSGEGGMAVFAQSEPARISRLLRNQGMEKRYQNEVVGFNLRMTDIHAAIGISQLTKVKKWTLKRRENAEYLNSKIESVITPFTPTGFEHVYHQYTVRIETGRDAFSNRLTELGIGNSVYYPTQVHKLPSFNRTLDLFHTQNATEQVLSLPIHPSLSKKDLDRIASAVNKVGAELN